MQPPSSAADDDGMNLRVGSTVTGNHGEYEVMKLLGEGGFGAVYRVRFREKASSTSTSGAGATLGGEYAMKVEKKMEKRKHSKLKMEVAILKLVTAKPPAPGQKKHFTDIIDRGRKENFFFLVMTLVGQSLDDLKRKNVHKVFSLPTGLAAGIQCLEAVQQLHNEGYIHRDLKPANYAIGLNEDRRTIYLLDFGISRRFLNDSDEVKTPRVAVPFKGTVRFASISCHKNIEMCPKDDCESWFYLLLDMLIVTGLPWKKFADREDVLKCKKDMRENIERRHGSLYYGLPCKEFFDAILNYIDNLSYTTAFDYGYVVKMLRKIAVEAQADLEAKFDWERDAVHKTARTASSFSSVKTGTRTRSR